MGIINTIASRDFCIYNRTIARCTSVDAAIVYGELASEFCYWEKSGKLEEGFFYSTMENLETNTSLTQRRIRKAIAELTSANLLEQKYCGIPRKRYFRLNENGLFLLLQDDPKEHVHAKEECQLLSEPECQMMTKSEDQMMTETSPIDLRNQSVNSNSPDNRNKKSNTNNTTNTANSVVLQSLIQDCRPSTQEQKDLIVACFNSGMREEVIREALKLPFARNIDDYLSGKPYRIRNPESYSYSVLDHWREAHVKTMEDARKYNRIHKNDKQMRRLTQ